MVYSGKPSRACHACRQRKTRCDAKPEGCSQCAKSKRQCPGYRRTVDLIFRDQSQTVIRKAKALEERRADLDRAKRAKGNAAASPFEDDDDAHVEEQQLVFRPHQFSVDTPIYPSCEDRAWLYFATNHSIGITLPGSGEFHSLTVSFVADIMDDTLTTTIKATSLASYAQHVHSKELANSARFEYMKAIRATNAALSSPTDVTKDSTLLSVMLLGFYEMLTGRTQSSMKDWARHVRGASALLKIRGRQQFETAIGRRIFLQAAASMLSSCLQRLARVPVHIVEMMDLMSEWVHSQPFPFPDYVRRGVGMFHAMFDYNELRCDWKEKKLSSVEELIARALQIDEPLAAVSSIKPGGWQYNEYVDKSLNPEIVFEGYYHVYKDDWLVSVWNNVRTLRLMIHDQIREELLAGFTSRPPRCTLAEHTAQFQRSTDLCYQLQADTLASVPQALGYVEKSGAWQAQTSEPSLSGFSLDANQPSETTAPSLMPPPIEAFPSPPRSSFSWEDLIADEPLPTHRVLTAARAPSCNGFTLLWPLWFAGFIGLSSPAVRKYCIANLRRIGEDMGIQQAFVMARSLEIKTEPKAWYED